MLADPSQLLSGAPTPTARRRERTSRPQAGKPQLESRSPPSPVPPPPPGVGRPGRASPVSSRPPSSAHSRTPVSQQLTMVSATRPVRPLPALLAGARRSRFPLAPPPPPPALLPRRSSLQLQLETAASPGNPRSPASSGRCVPAPEPAPRVAAAAAAWEEPGGVSLRRAPSLHRTSKKRSRGRGRFIIFPRPTSYPGTSFQ